VRRVQVADVQVLGVHSCGDCRLHWSLERYSSASHSEGTASGSRLSRVIRTKDENPATFRAPQHGSSLDSQLPHTR
jgi:hypothetical protein